MDFYQLTKKINELSESSLVEAPPPPDEECKLKMKDVPLPTEQYKSIEVDLPTPRDNEWMPDCENLRWLPRNQQAQKWLITVIKKYKELNPSPIKTTIDPDAYNPLSPDFIGGVEDWRVLRRQILVFLLNTKKGKNWYSMYPSYAQSKIRDLTERLAQIYAERLRDGTLEGGELQKIDNNKYWVVTDNVVEEMFKDLIFVFPTPEQLRAQYGEGKEYAVESKVTDQDEIVELIAREAYIRMPQIFKEHGDEYVMNVIDKVAEHFVNKEATIDEMLYKLADIIEDNNLIEGAATVFSDAKGHHLKNADGEVVQSFEGTPEGLRQARNALYANYNVLSMEKPKESTMNEFEEKFNNALNESLTINTTAGTDQPDSVNVTATDEDAHTLVAILKAAGLPYKEQEAKLTMSPCAMGEAEEDTNLSYTPNDANSLVGSVDTMLNKLSGGLNKVKNQYRPAAGGDNPMAIKEDELMRGLWNLYSEYK